MIAQSYYRTQEEEIAFKQWCLEQPQSDIRHLGKYLNVGYFCETCGYRIITLTPDYPYASPNKQETCSRCAGVMELHD